MLLMAAYDRFDCGHEPGVCPGMDNEVSNFIDSHIDMIQPHPRSIVDYSLGKKKLYTCRELSKPCTFLPPAPRDQTGYRQKLVFGTLKKEHDRFSDVMKNFAFS